MTARTPSARISGVAVAVAVAYPSGTSRIEVGPGSPPQSSSSSELRAIAAARSANRRRPSSSERFVDATPTRFPATNRRFTWTFHSDTFWWISLFANRVRLLSSAIARTSTSDGDSASVKRRARSARARTSVGVSPFSLPSVTRCPVSRSPLADAHLDVPEPRSGAGVANARALARLAFAAVRRPEHAVARLVADGVAGSPELVRDAGVRRVLEEATLLAVLDLVRDLGRELEIQAAVVDRPRPVRGEIDPVVRVSNDVVEAHAGFGKQVEVRHPDQRDAVPAVGPHRAT